MSRADLLVIIATLATVIAGIYLILAGRGWLAGLRRRWMESLPYCWYLDVVTLPARMRGRRASRRPAARHAAGRITLEVRADASQALAALDDATAAIDALMDDLKADRLAALPVPYWPAYLPAPAPREADSAGQDPDAATVLPPDGAAPLPRPHAVPPSADGLGQRPFDAPVAVTRDWQYREDPWAGIVRMQPVLWPRDGRNPYSPEAARDTTHLILGAPIDGVGNRDVTQDWEAITDPPLRRPWMADIERDGWTCFRPASPVWWIAARDAMQEIA